MSNSNNYGEIISDEKQIEDLEQGITFDWTLGYSDMSGYLIQARPIDEPIPDAQEIEHSHTTAVIDAGTLCEMWRESDTYRWIDWGNGVVGLGITEGDTQYYVVPMPRGWEPAKLSIK
jgi:hypothetical protein